MAMTGAASAATMTVTTTTEGSPGDGFCSLREAVLAANENGANASDCGKGDGGLDVIQLGAFHYTLSRSGVDDSAANGDLDVADDLTIVGVSAASTVIDGGGVDRVFDVKAVTADLQRVTITGGQAPHGTAGPNATATNPLLTAQGGFGSVGAGGGGIRNAGTLVLTDCVVTLNHAGNGGVGGFGQGAAGTAGTNGTNGGAGRSGGGGGGGSGGGILSTAGSLRLERTVVRDNTAGNGGASGGGFGGTGGLATGASGTGGAGGGGSVEQAGPGGDGGGVAATGGTVQVVDSTVAGNSAGAGGHAGLGQGGLGGVAIGDSGTGGNGGRGQPVSASPPTAGSGGDGGGIALTTGNADSLISGSVIEDNESGAGGDGGEAFGGLGGGASGDARPAGTGGQGTGGNGGDGGYGGGVVLDGVIRNSTISGNRTGTGGAGGAGHGGKGGSTPGGDGDGGFAFGGDAGDGGPAAVELLGASSSPLELVHDTIVANALGGAGTPGSAVGGAPGNGSTGSTGGAAAGKAGSAGNVGGVLGTGTIANTIVSGNGGFGDCAGPLSDGGHNISFPGLACPGANVDPNLGPLADNGGPTRTHALLAGSPAVAGVPASGSGCLARDQRGVARPQGDACDIGAYENAPPIVSIGGVSGLTTTAATILGTVTANLRTTSYRFEYGPTTAYGNLTPEENLPAGAAGESVSAALSGLTPGATITTDSWQRTPTARARARTTRSRRMTTAGMARPAPTRSGRTRS